MMNSLLYWQAYFCWLIINDLLASQENKVFEKLKNKNIGKSSLLVTKNLICSGKT